LGVIYLRWRRIEPKHAAGAVGLMIVMFGVLSIYGYEKVAARLDDLTDGSLQALDHNEGRRKIWVANLAAFEHGWLTGSGAGSHRATYPVYLKESPPTEYTHAENGYLQIATETGVLGIALLCASFGLCGWWCYTCLARLQSPTDQLWFGAVAAGLVASAVHSLVDFVWYIPACMSVTVVLAACGLCLARRTLPESRTAAGRRNLTRPRCCEAAAACLMIGAWCVYSLFGPAMASVHWDRYLRASADKTELAKQQLSALLDRREEVDSASAEPLLESMLQHLRAAAYWDPRHSRVQLRLASKCLAEFELLQQRAENAMPLFQLREAVLASHFESPAELRTWLERAVGENAAWLYRAYDHARRAATLCPLQGEAYLQLASLCFLDGSPRQVSQAYVDQGLLVRPYDADVLFEAGNQSLLTGDFDAAIRYWKKCFRDAGKHQLRIIHALAGPQIPASVLIHEFQPDWSTLRHFWSRYRQFGKSQDLNDLVTYAEQVTLRQVKEEGGPAPAYIWLYQAQMLTDVDRPADALSCLEQAHRLAPHLYPVRNALSRALMTAGRISEAEPHVRWCLARQPDNTNLKALLLEINKQRFSQRERSGYSR
jgi:tetratricopeptide (TPR) repeat protein